MHIILTGATGLVGSGVLQTMLINPSITKLSILSRRPVPQAENHNKANVIIHKDFTTYPESVLDQLKGAEGCVWALGISSVGMDRETYKEITHTYAIRAAQSFTSLSRPSPFKFIYVSGEGATQTPSMFTQMFGTIKGQTEADLLALSSQPEYDNLRVINVRPAGVDAGEHKEIAEFVPKKSMMMKALTVALLPLVRGLQRDMLTPTKNLGEVCTQLVAGDGEKLEGKGVVGVEGRILSNVALRRLGGW
ncbi:nucleoside-diphosphate-sugar epimerase protein [Rutstroemia sp. NJR-2017a BBW]|nr:nucleoside-diphosphate-sugar epimerase protein [Rutstroemia sp. NJR-2017a BBW]